MNTEDAAEKIRQAFPNLDYLDFWEPIDPSHRDIPFVAKLDGDYSAEELRAIAAALDQLCAP